VAASNPQAGIVGVGKKMGWVLPDASCFRLADPVIIVD
jgi:hypothetical protein